MDWQEKLKSLVVDHTKREMITLKLLRQTPEFRTALFDVRDDALLAAILGIIESAAAGHGLLSQEQWLRQTLQVELPPFGSQPEPRGDNNLDLRLRFDRWDIMPDIEPYLSRADGADKKHLPLDQVLRVTVDNEAAVQFEFWKLVQRVGLVVLGSTFSVRPGCNAGFSSRRRQMSPSELVQSFASGRPSDTDMVLALGSRDFLVVEMKLPSVLRTGVDVECPDLIDAYNDLSMARHPARSEALVEPVYEIYKYMKFMNLGYGIITSLDLSYFVRRVGDTLQISQAITCGSSALLGALAYFLDMAAGDLRDFNAADQGGNVGVGESPEDSSQGEDCNDSLFPRIANVEGPHPMVTRSGGKGRQREGLRETPAEYLHLEAHPFATGWSGYIVRGTYEGLPVAVKLAPFGSHRAEALLTEIMVYHKLKKYWGKYVPALVSFGTTAGGKVVYIATEVVKGHEIGIGYAGALTPEVMKATCDALNVVHESGIIHGDIRCSNILVVKKGRGGGGGGGGVRLIDFGFSRLIASGEDCKRERAQLEYMLKQISGSQWYPSNVEKIGQLSQGAGIEAL